MSEEQRPAAVTVPVEGEPKNDNVDDDGVTATNVVVVNRIQKLSQITVDMIHKSTDGDDASPATAAAAAAAKMICLCGWVYSVRIQGSGGSLIFIDINDGSVVTPVRCLAEYETTQEEAAAASDSLLYKYNNDTSSTVQYGHKEDDNEGSGNATTAKILPIDTSEYKKLTFEEISQSNYCCIGCSVMIFGYVTEPPANTNASQLYEIKISSLYLIGSVPDASKYPIQKSILKKPVALRNYYHTRFRAPIIQQFMIIRSTALYTIHEYFYTIEKTPLLDPNIITNNDCEGAGEIFTLSNTSSFFHSSTASAGTTPHDKKSPPTVTIIKEKMSSMNIEEEGATTTTSTNEKASDVAAEETTPSSTTDVVVAPNPNLACSSVPMDAGLTVSSQLPLEAIAMGTGAVYTCQKSFRAEKSDTNKHLAEFLHIEYEAYFITLHDLMNQVERFVKYVIRMVVERCAEQYAFLNHRTTGPEEFHQHNTYLLSLLDKPFVRIKHADAVTVLLEDARNKVQVYNPVTKQSSKLKFKCKPAHGEDLGSEHEKYLVQKYGTFVFVTHWPAAIKSFYMKQNLEDGTCDSFDLLAPIVGELFGGSMREWRYDVLQGVMEKKQMDLSTLQWFIDLRKDGGTAPHGGWGMGFDRLVMFLTNTQSVRDIVPYPVYYGHCPY